MKHVFACAVVVLVPCTSNSLWWSAETAPQVPVVIPAQVSAAAQLPVVPATAVKSVVSTGTDLASDVMNQNLTFNLNYSPTQVKMPLMLPPAFMQHIMEKIPLATCKEWGGRMRGFMDRRKYFLVACAGGCGYAWVCHLCVRANVYMARPELWCMWKRLCPTDELLLVPHDELARELLIEIQRRYVNHQNPTDFIGPLITFVHNVEDEMTMLAKIRLLSKCISRLFLTKIFPLNSDVIATIDERIKRLKHLNDVFLSWVAQYTVEHNKRRPRTPPFGPA